ncbi:hypothetical protein [Brachybacterium sp. GU-2]|uniref:hypothetical protein n=1 Tax=Brachybacterium sp. GU-2 TaxID=3069708 RepID=UPI00280A6CFF|nr:hypothetical protein [Brachybacterium sp. GU-2]WME22377.1 hypothetical protein RBL05_12685 [Brachybacterium sp. GU-2]
MDRALDAYFNAIAMANSLFNLDTTDSAGARFLFALILAALTIAILAICLHIIPRELAFRVRSGAEAIARGGSLEAARRLEAYSGALFRGLTAFSLIWGRTTYGVRDSRSDRLPPATEHPRTHVLTGALRSILLAIGRAFSILRVIGLAVPTTFGIASIAIALTLAFPQGSKLAIEHSISSIIDATRRLTHIGISPLAILTTLSTLIALLIVGAKFLRTDRMLAKRKYRHEREVETIGLLHEITPLVHNLAEALDEDVTRHVIARESAYLNFLEWWRTMTSSSASSPLGLTLEDSHLKCTAECQDAFDHSPSRRSPSPGVTEALGALESRSDLCSALGSRRVECARLLSLKAWQGYTTVFPMPSLGRPRKIADHIRFPNASAWENRRIDMQHEALRHLPLEEQERLDNAEPLENLAKPDQTWEAERLTSECWDMFEAIRSIRQLVDYSERLLGSTRLEKMLARMTAS